MSEYEEHIEYAVRRGVVTDTDAFNAVCDQLARAETEIESLRAALAAAEKERDRAREALENIAAGAATHWSQSFARRALRPEAVAEGEKE